MRFRTPYEFDIFISYGHDDADTAACLASRLDDEGFRCFLAEKDIRSGEQWEPRIRDARIASERVLLLITPNSKDSRWVNAEAGAAWALDKPLIPALMFVKPDEVIELIRKHQARPVHNQTEIDRFVELISESDRSIYSIEPVFMKEDLLHRHSNNYTFAGYLLSLALGLRHL